MGDPGFPLRVGSDHDLFRQRTRHAHRYQNNTNWILDNCCVTSLLTNESSCHCYQSNYYFFVLLDLSPTALLTTGKGASGVFTKHIQFDYCSLANSVLSPLCMTSTIDWLLLYTLFASAEAFNNVTIVADFFQSRRLPFAGDPHCTMQLKSQLHSGIQGVSVRRVLNHVVLDPEHDWGVSIRIRIKDQPMKLTYLCSTFMWRLISPCGGDFLAK